MPNPLQSCKFLQMLAPIDVNGITATDTEIDTLGWHYLAVHVSVGVISANQTACTLNESDTASQTGDVFVTFTPQLATGGDATQQVAFIDLRKRKRYISLVDTGGAAATLISVTGILWRGDQAPDTATERGLSEQFVI